MKKIIPTLVTAVLGSAFTIGILWSVGIIGQQNIKVHHLNSSPVSGAVYTANNAGEIIPLDFTDVSSQAMESVVHIKSTQTKLYANNSGNQFHYYHKNDPFQKFFGDDFFKDFFQPHFRFESPNQPNKPGLKVGTGSGVIINEEGYIITNNHVIDNADDVEVTLHDNRSYKATVVGTDPSTDLALIQIKEKGLKPLSLVNSDEVEVGEWVLAVGNPFNLNSTVTAGIVSAKSRNINILKDKSAVESFIQTDAAINPGNSGGALVNLQGGLVGINTSISSPTGSYAGYGFAVPSSIVSKVADDLLKYGVVQRGFLGITIRNVDGNLADEKELEVTEGVFVDSLMAESAAKDAGIKKHDVIMKVDGKNVKSVPELQELISRKRPGEDVELLVNRNGKEKTMIVTLKNKEGNKELVEKSSSGALLQLGAEFKNLDKSESKKLDIEGGVKVSKLYAGVLRRQTQMKEGFVITKVGEKNIKSIDDLKEELDGKKGGILFEGVYPDYPGKHYYAFGLK